MPPRKSGGSSGTASFKGRGKKARGKAAAAGAARKARSGTHKALSPPDVPQRLYSPEEGYWDATGWVDASGAEEGGKEDVRDVTQSATVTPIRQRAPIRSSTSTPAQHTPARSPAPYPSPQTTTRPAASHNLSPRSRAVFNELPYTEPLFQGHSRSPTPSASPPRQRHPLTPLSSSRSLGHKRPRDAEEDDQPESSPLATTYNRAYPLTLTPAPPRRKPSGTRVVLGELSLPSPEHHRQPSLEPQPRHTRITKHKTYSRRVPYAYRLPPPPERVYSQPHSTPARSRAVPNPSHQGTRDTKPSIDRVDEELFDVDRAEDDVFDPFSQYGTPAPPQPRKRRRITSTATPEAESEPEEDDERYSYERYYDAEGEPDLAHELFAPNSPLPTHLHDPTQLIPFTTALGRRRVRFPPATRPPRPPSPLPVIFEEKVPPRLRFGRARPSYYEGEAKNHRRQGHIIPRRRRRGHIVPLHQPVPLPRSIPRIPIAEYLAAYAHRPKPFPVNTQLVESGHRAVLEKRPRRSRGGAGDGYAPHNPAIPRIVHASDIPDSTIEPPSRPSSQARYDPAERFHHAAPGRLALRRGRAAGRQSNNALPPLLFAKHAPSRAGWYAGTSSREDAADSTRRAGARRSVALNSVPTQDSTPRNPPSSGTLGLRFPDPTQGPADDMDFWADEGGTAPDFEPEDGANQAYAQSYTGTPTPPPAAEDTVVIVMDNGEEVALSRADAEAYAVAALAEFAEPLSPGQFAALRSPSAAGSVGAEEIEHFDEQSSATTQAAAAAAPARRALAEITPPSTAHLSGIHMTDYLLRIAERGVAAPKTAREVRLDERRARLASSSRSSVSSARRAPSSASSSQRLRLPPNPFAHDPAPTESELGPHKPQPYSLSTGVRALPGPRRQFQPHKQSQPTQKSQPIPPTPAARLTAAFKAPSRLDAPPPPQPTLADLLQQQLTRSFPSYAARRPREPSPQPVPLGTRMRRTKSARR